MSDTLVILGAGGHAKVCYEIAVKMEKWSNYIVLDDNAKNIFFEVKGKISEFVDYPKADFFVAIGSNKVRKNLFEKIKDKGYKLTTLIHPAAIISPTAQIGEGTVVMAGVIVNADTTIGKGCILNTACLVDHDNTIGSFVHISPGVHLAGTVTIGENSWAGLGANIINNITIGSNSIIGAGSLVLTDLPGDKTYYGSPVEK